jgi:hypothetical protein
VRSVWALAGASAFLGLGFELAFPAWMAAVSQASPPDRRGQIMGAVGLAQGAGALIGVALAPVIYTSDIVSLPRLGVNHINLPFYLCAILLSVATVMVFTWISVRRGKQNGGRQITWKERRAITALAILGVVIITGWVVFRYTRPVSADRVAWLWVQAAAEGNARKASRYTLPSFEQSAAIDGQKASVISSRVYRRWVKGERASYKAMSPEFFDEGKSARVRLVFRFPDRSRAFEMVVMERQESGEWKVAEKHSEKARNEE